MFILHNYGVPSKIANLNMQSYEKLRKVSNADLQFLSSIG